MQTAEASSGFLRNQQSPANLAKLHQQADVGTLGFDTAEIQGISLDTDIHPSPSFFPPKLDKRWEKTYNFDLRF